MLYLPCCLLLSITLHEELQIWNFSSMSNLELGITNQSAAYNKVSITIITTCIIFLCRKNGKVPRGSIAAAESTPDARCSVERSTPSNQLRLALSSIFLKMEATVVGARMASRVFIRQQQQSSERYSSICRAAAVVSMPYY